MAMADGGGLSELGVLVAQLESVVHSGSQKPLQPLMCFDLLSDLLSVLDRESKVRRHCHRPNPCRFFCWDVIDLDSRVGSYRPESRSLAGF